jgi:hypothetical protein
MTKRLPGLLLASMASLTFGLATSPGAASQDVVHYGCNAPVKLDQFAADDLGHMGQSIALGDFNHDGVKDIVMGGYDRQQAQNDQPPDDMKTKVYVFLGTGSSSAPLFRERLEISGPQALDLFGFSVAFVGDLNGDQCDELLVGAPRWEPPSMTDSGRVWLFYGRPTLSADVTGSPVTDPATSAAALTFDGTIDGGWFGASIATAKDANGAFLKEMVVGAPGNSVTSTTVKGSVYLYASPTLEDASVVAGSIPGVAIGASPLTGTPGITGSSTAGWLAIAHRVPSGIGFGDLFGQSVAFVGDLDGVAGQEYLVGAPQYASETGLSTTKGPGYVRLFRKGNDTPLITIYGEQLPSDNPRQEGEAFGFSVAGGIQLNPESDSVPDILVGAPFFNAGASSSSPGAVQAGRVMAYSGLAAGTAGDAVQLLTASAPDDTLLVGTNGSDQFGYSIGVASDINGDGREEILVGAWQGSIASATACVPPQHPALRTGFGGYAILYSTFLPSPGDKLAVFYGEAYKDHLGRAVASGQLFGTTSHPEIVLSGLAWNVAGDEHPDDPTENGRGYVWDGETVLTSSP